MDLARPARTVAAALITTLVAVPLLILLPGGVAPAAASSQPCRVGSYMYKIRNVRGTTTASVYRFHSKSYGVATTVKKGKKVTSSSSTNLSAAAQLSTGVEGGANGVLEKVVGVYAKAHADLDLQGSVATTRQESQQLVTDVTRKVKAGTTLIWYRGRMSAHGTFQISQCSSDSGGNVGHVTWKKHRWSSYSKDVASGTWTCALKAQTVFQTAAQRKAGCYGA